MENSHIIKQINNILEYDFDYFKEISNLETEFIDILDIDLTEEQYFSIHNGVHCDIIYQNMTIINKTKDKIKKDFNKKIEQIIALEEYKNNIDFNAPVFEKWFDLFLEFDMKDCFFYRTFMLSYPLKFDSWFENCKKNETAGFFGSILLNIFYPYSYNLNHDEEFLHFINNSDIVESKNIDNMLQFLYDSNPKNKKQINGFMAGIFDSLFLHHSQETEVYNDIIKKSLQLSSIIEKFNIHLGDESYKNFKKKIVTELDKFLRVENEIYVQKNIDLLFTYHPLFNKNTIKDICTSLYHKEKIPFIENEILKRTIIIEEKPTIKTKKRL